jgi:hypothetical protein
MAGECGRHGAGADIPVIPEAAICACCEGGIRAQYGPMSVITESFTDAAAPDADAMRNGRGLVAKGKLSGLHRSGDGTVIFGECAGSGSTPYRCSVDVVDPAKPVWRCTCPSRKIPCKHALAVAYAFALGKPFSEAEVPADLAEKRGKAAARAEKKAAEADAPVKPVKAKQVNKGALRKKIETQIEGLGVLETLVADVVRRGLGTMDAKAALEADKQAKQLGDAFLPGAQGVLNELTALFRGTDGRYRTDLAGVDRDAMYREAGERLARAHALAKRGREYLEQRLADEEMKPDVASSIAAWLGHAWQLAELEEQGCFVEGAELVQLAFECVTNRARQQWVDTGVWCHLQGGRLYRTLNIRPFKAAAHIKQDDSVFEVQVMPKLYTYPGEGARRVRWDEASARPVTPADCGRIRESAPRAVAEVVKGAREQLKSPLAEREVWALLHFARLGKVGGSYVVEDAAGGRLELSDPAAETRPPALPLLEALPTEAFSDQTLLGCLRHDWARGRLVMEPVTLITPQQIVRFGY